MTKATESHFYLFLANYGDKWKEDADKPNRNGTKDGMITKYELKTFMINNWEGFCPEGITLGDLSNSLFDSFFEKLDTNYKGDANFGQLKGKELEEMERKIALYRQLNDYIKDKCDNDYPSELDTKYFGHWKTSVADALAQAIDGKVDNLDEKSLQTALDAAYPGAKAYATATCYAAQYADSDEIKELLSDLTSQYGYRIDDDKTLETIIKRWTTTNLTSDMTLADIQDNIERIVKAYLATADIGVVDEAEIDFIKSLGYNDKNLTDLQSAQVKKMRVNLLEAETGDQQNVISRDGTNLSPSYIEHYNRQRQEYIDKHKNDELPEVTPEEGESAFAAQKRHAKANTVKDFKESPEYKRNYAAVTQINYNYFAPSQAVRDHLTTAGYGDLLNEIISGNRWWDKISGYEAAYNKICKDIREGGTQYLNEDGSPNYDATGAEMMTIFKNYCASLKAEKERKRNEAVDGLTNTVNNIKSNNINNIISGYNEMHTEFGIKSDGTITFEHENARKVFESLVNTLYNSMAQEQMCAILPSHLECPEFGKVLLVSNKADFTKLVQSAWIMTYNSKTSNETHSTANFVSEVLNNLNKILNSLKTHPEYLQVYTGHTAYANTNLTNNLIHYNTKTTKGGDEIISYEGGYSTSEDGVVHLSNTYDDEDYQNTMSELLDRLIKNYPTVDRNIITEVFRNAQRQAIDICVGNVADCPYGTGNNGQFVEDGDPTEANFRAGQNSRCDDDSKIYMRELVQLTLYCFDKLLYQRLAS